MIGAGLTHALQVLAKDSSIAIGNLSGASNPVAVFDDRILDELSALCQKAKAEALANPPQANSGAALELCAALSRVLDLYTSVRNKYYGGLGPHREYAAVQRDLEDAMAQLKKFER